MISFSTSVGEISSPELLNILTNDDVISILGRLVGQKLNRFSMGKSQKIQIAEINSSRCSQYGSKVESEGCCAALLGE